MVDPLKLFWVITNSTYLGRFLFRFANFPTDKKENWTRVSTVDDAVNGSTRALPLEANASRRRETFSRPRNDLSAPRSKNARDDSFPATRSPSTQQRILSKRKEIREEQAMKFQLFPLAFSARGHRSRMALFSKDTLFAHCVQTRHNCRCHSIPPKIDSV